MVSCGSGKKDIKTVELWDIDDNRIVMVPSGGLKTGRTSKTTGVVKKRHISVIVETAMG